MAHDIAIQYHWRVTHLGVVAVLDDLARSVRPAFSRKKLNAPTAVAL
jgi:hypothetical protein